jgi:hypothetical protein
MHVDLKALAEKAGVYAFDTAKLDAIPVTGTLKKTDVKGTYLLVLAETGSGDLVTEIVEDDVVGFEEKDGGQVTLKVKPDAVLTTTLRGKAASALVPGYLALTGAGLDGGRIPPSLPWRDLVQPFTRLDQMLNMIDVLDWNGCRARVYERCGGDPVCITNGLIACGPRPKLRVSERTLERLAEYFREELIGGPGVPGDPRPPV